MNSNRSSEEETWQRDDASSDGALRDDTRQHNATHRSGEYRAVQGEAPSDLLKSFDAPGPIDEVADRSSSDHPFRKPFASLLPGTRLEDFGVAPASTPPSLRRPLSAAPPRRLGSCHIHRIALSPEGDCVLCRREAAPKSGLRSMFGLAGALLIAIVVAAYLMGGGF